MKKRKLKKGSWQKIVATALLTCIVVYSISGLLYGLLEKINLRDALLNYESVFQFLQTTSPEYLLVIVAISGLFIGWFLKHIDIFEKTYEDASEHGVHGSGRMAKPIDYINKEITAKRKYTKYDNNDKKVALGTEEGIILAREENKKNLITIPEDTSADNKNVLVIGSSGSSKGQGYVIPNLINIRNETMIVTDPKGELFNLTSQLKRDQGYDVYQIDFVDFEQSQYNILDYVNSDQDAQSVSMTIAKNATEKPEIDFFGERAQKILFGLIVYCKSVNKQANMNDVIHVYNEYVSPSQEMYHYFVDEVVGKDNDAYSTLKGTTSLEGPTRASVLSNFDSSISSFRITKVNQMTRKSDFNFYDFQKQKSILYVKIPMRKNPFQAITATFFDQLIDTFYSIADKQDDDTLPIKTTFLLDEFANIGKLNGYDETLATCRGLGLSMQTIIQDNAQLEKKYGKEGARTIISNHATRLFLKTGDPETAKYFASLTESSTVRFETGGMSQSGGILSTKNNHSTSENEQYQKKELVSAGKLTNLEDDECYIFSTSASPLKAKKAFQFIIYNGFLTDKNRKPCYRNNREEYIKVFNLKPFVPQQKEEPEEPFKEAKDLIPKPPKEEDIILQDDELTQEELDLMNTDASAQNGDKQTISIEGDDVEETLQGLENDLYELEEVEGTIDQDTINDAAEQFNLENEEETYEEKEDDKVKDELPIY
ncbi:type IV secretory system conjugative DNA transfer family protein (plasmid) [Virgibacillus necropolis]|uniref:VirD4-like conjugal transfer protein, CD1115 family n=1 Tax=Virgibacillus necropolis TaxID=163877 RepID=UPI00384FD80E